MLHHLFKIKIISAKCARAKEKFSGFFLSVSRKEGKILLFVLYYKILVYRHLNFVFQFFEGKANVAAGSAKELGGGYICFIKLTKTKPDLMKTKEHLKHRWSEDEIVIEDEKLG